RRPDPAADPGPPGDGEGALQRRGAGDVLRARGWRALNVPASVEGLLRELAPQVLGAVARWSGDFAAAEDAVQEALLAAAVRWPRNGTPDKPKAWLIQTASRRLIDEVRQEQARRRREERAALRDVPAEDVEEQ